MLLSQDRSLRVSREERRGGSAQTNVLVQYVGGTVRLGDVVK